MNWTKDKPTKPGWYWHRRKVDRVLEIVIVTDPRSRGYLYSVGLNREGLFSSCVLDNRDGEWQGQITPEEGEG